MTTPGTPGGGEAGRRDATNRDVLDDRQELALNALLAGATHEEAANAAGVHRTTVSGWTRRDANFIAERNRRRAELTERVGSALVNAAARAVEAALAAIEAEAAEGKATVSLGLLKLVDPRGLVLADWPGGPTTVKGVEAEQSRRRDMDMLQSLGSLSGLGLADDWDDEDGEDEFDDDDDEFEDDDDEFEDDDEDPGDA